MGLYENLIMRRIILRLLALLVTTTACGTLDHGPLQRVHVASDPSGALVEAAGCGGSSAGSQKRTPATLWVSRRATKCIVTVSLPGFQPETVSFTREVSGAVAGNLDAIGSACSPDENCRQPADTVRSVLAGALASAVGVGIDALSGGMWKQVPSRVSLKLSCTAEADPAASETPDEESAPHPDPE